MSRIFTYSKARQNLAEVLRLAQSEKVMVRRRDGTLFSIVEEKPTGGASVFDVPSIHTDMSTQDIVRAVRNARHPRTKTNGK